MNDTPHSSRVGSQFGPYQLTRLLGRGGMGEVYEAHDTAKDRTVALKLLPEHLSHDPVFRERLQREARSAGRLQEPHVVPIHDYGEIDGHLFVDMRLIDGVDLRTVLNRTGPMDPARAVWIVTQIASALDAAHAAGILHRDVKPENILLTRDDFAYLVDFGIASAATDRTLTEKGTAIGTYAYMAPERFTNREVSHQADVYALACVLHQCLTGAQPFPADSISMLITAHLMEPAPRPTELRPDLPPAFDAVIAHGMAKAPEDRYPTAGELARAAAAATGGSAHQATVPAAQFTWPTHPGAAPQRRGKRGPWILAGAGAGVVLLVAAAVSVVFVQTRNGTTTVASTQTITRTVTSSPRTPPDTTAALTTDERRLFELLPAGSDACAPAKPPITGALATVDCGAGSADGGPQSASYSLFADADALDDAFQRGISEDDLTACPGGFESPGSWDYDTTPDEVEGSLACGTYNGIPDLVWTKTSDLVLGTAQGADLDELHSWWMNNI